jgi:endo-1,4-beta-xylanase
MLTNRARPRFARSAFALFAVCSALTTLSCGEASDGRYDRITSTVEASADGGETASGSTVAEACSVKTLACATNKLVGAAVNAQALDDVPAYSEVLAREFDYVTPENVMKWGPLQPTPGVWNFSAADALLTKAAANGQSVKGHALVWHLQMPPWAEELQGTALVDAVHAHVSACGRSILKRAG